jgi:membrane protease subunit (stomatin/prohibitin family)
MADGFKDETAAKNGEGGGTTVPSGNFCTACGAGNPADARFCNKCGIRLPA